MNCFLTFEELKQYRPQKPTYFVFGDPIGHSLSPKLHNSYFSLSHLDGEYLAVRVGKNQLQEAIDCVKGYAKGVNLTIPLKEAVIPILDEIDEKAERIGAVNTLQFENNKVKGYNTDFDGIELSLKKMGVDLTGASTLILGNGGAAKAMLAVAQNHTDRITVAGRNLDKVSDFCEGTPAKPALLSQIKGGYQVVLNATSVGMGEQMGQSPLTFSQLKDCGFLFDSIYNPFHTNFLTLGKARGINGINGLWMLVYQGLKAEEIWENPVDYAVAEPIFESLQAAFTGSEQNIVLTGYMGCGKTTVGRELSTRSGMPFYDMDEMLEEIMGDTISHIFETRGETYFREQETCLAKALSALNGGIISTGGGVVKNPENIRHLKENGQVFFLHPPFSEIKKRLMGDTTRPLLKDPAQTEKIYQERLKLYLESADHKITSTDAKESAGEILEIFHS
ncbi:MAG: hypothetical protein IJ367_04860 [Clostridia bacterium]|nr:hypothetical protein [Clostridia bacterium]